MKNNFLRTLAVVMTMVMVLSISLVFAEDTGIPKRSDIAEQYKWKLEHIYKTTADWEKDYATVQKELLPQIAEYKGKLGDPSTVLECLQLSDRIGTIVDRLYVYAGMSADQNNADNVASELASRAESLNTASSEAQSFMVPELMGKSAEVLKQDYVNNTAFKDYKYYFTKLLNQKAHILSDAEEKLLAMTGDMAASPEDIFGKVTTADIEIPVMKDKEGNEFKLTRGKFSAMLSNPDRAMRKEAFEKHFATYDKVKNTLAATLSAEVNKNVFNAKARKYNSALEASVTGNNNIPVAVYDNLVESVNNNLDYLHKYVSLRKKVMDVDKIHYYDMYTALVDDFEIRVEYDDAKKMVKEGLKPMGTEYGKLIDTAFADNWIDVYETENKTTGGYSWGSYDTHPYILLNYNDTMNEMFTVAHELGHAMHSNYTNSNQKYRNSNYTTFLAEVASTTNEFLMQDYMMKHAKSNQEKLYLINNMVENIRGSVYTQIMYAEFEKVIHEKVEAGEALSADSMNELWGKLMEKYYGADFEVDPLVKLWWSRIPHFYMNFYVYNYATGIAGAYPLSQGILKGEKGAVDKYMGFLKAGDSDYPVEILKSAGVDMTSTKPVDDLLKLFNELVDEMEQILREEGKIE
ncbi:MAG: oligopeptidase PepB [Clostridia bacterium BRH_c25]|nr:MAG: oligopeptidase PepB [Clostridia bacterium BRH_c25]